MTTVVTTKNTVRELVPVVRERLADLETPVSAFAKLRPLGGAFLLESVEGGERMGRYSFIGVLPRTTLRAASGCATRRSTPPRSGVLDLRHRRLLRPRAPLAPRHRTRDRGRAR